MHSNSLSFLAGGSERTARFLKSWTMADVRGKEPPVPSARKKETYSEAKNIFPRVHQPKKEEGKNTGITEEH